MRSIVKIIVLVGLVFIILALIDHGYRYTNACVTDIRQLVYGYGERLQFNAFSATEIIPYDMLSDEYKTEVSKEDYYCDEPLQKFMLYNKEIFKRNSKKKVDIDLSTAGYKAQPMGYIQIGDNNYFITHEIDILPDWLTLEPKIVRWYIHIEKIETLPENVPVCVISHEQ